MKKELPGIFKKNVDTSHSNNKKVFYTSELKQETTKTASKVDKNIQDSTSSNNTLTTVEEKIRKLLRSSRYIFNIEVEIKTSKKTYKTKIAGKVKNSLVTIEGEIIPIVDIEDIIIKDRF